jgi:uncharacterized protein (TIGR03000 family)
MRKLFLVAVLAIAGLGLNAGRASAWWGWNYPPQPASVSFPMVYPSGWYTNTYYFPWYYPWYANYNYSHGSYSHWWQSHGWAFYEGQPIPGNFRIHPIFGAYFFYVVPVDGQPHPAHRDHILPLPKKKDGKKDPQKFEPGKVTITLPADATLLFNGVASTGTGEVRSFLTPFDLEDGRDYEYVLTSEVVRDGQTMTATERVIVRAGSVTPVTLAPTASVRK